MKYIDADLLRKEIDDIEEEARKVRVSGTDKEAIGADGKVRLCLKLKAIIDSLQQEQQESEDKSLDEAAEKYAEKHGFRVPYDGSNNFYDETDVKASLEGFKAGARWQKEQDQETIELAEDHAYLAGAEWQKSQMLKEAVEVMVEDWNPERHPEITIPLNPDMFTVGDRLRIIIVKED